MDATDKGLLESMTYGGIIADERNKERLDRLVEQGLAHVVERPDGFFPDSQPLNPVYCLTPQGREILKPPATQD